MIGLRSIVALSAAVMATTAFAAPADPDAVSVKVRIGDLNLSETNGASIALGRIDGAARQICGEAPSNVDLGGSAIYRRCIASAVGNGVASLGAPLVTAMNQARQDSQATYLASAR